MAESSNWDRKTIPIHVLAACQGSTGSSVELWRLSIPSLIVCKVGAVPANIGTRTFNNLAMDSTLSIWQSCNLFTGVFWEHCIGWWHSMIVDPHSKALALEKRSDNRSTENEWKSESFMLKTPDMCNVWSILSLIWGPCPRFHGHVFLRLFTIPWPSGLYHRNQKFLDDYEYTSQPPTIIGSGFSGDVVLCRSKKKTAVVQNQEIPGSFKDPWVVQNHVWKPSGGWSRCKYVRLQCPCVSVTYHYHVRVSMVFLIHLLRCQQLL